MLLLLAALPRDSVALGCSYMGRLLEMKQKFSSNKSRNVWIAANALITNFVNVSVHVLGFLLIPRGEHKI